MLKCVKSLRGPSSRHCARVTQLATFKELSRQWRAVGNSVINLAGPRFEAQFFLSRDGRLTAQPTDRYF